MTRPRIFDDWRIAITVRDGVSRVLPQAEIGRVVAAALAAGGAPRRASLSVILTDDDEIAELNVAHLGHEGPTDVLSFPLLPPDAYPLHVGGARGGAAAGRPDGVADPPPLPFVLPPRARLSLGDIVVSVERAAEQASEGRGGQTGNIRWSAADELRLLLTHGALHVCGWDHAEPAEEAAMRSLEQQLLGGATG